MRACAANILLILLNTIWRTKTPRKSRRKSPEMSEGTQPLVFLSSSLSSLFCFSESLSFIFSLRPCINYSSFVPTKDWEESKPTPLPSMATSDDSSTKRNGAPPPEPPATEFCKSCQSQWEEENMDQHVRHSRKCPPLTPSELEVQLTAVHRPWCGGSSGRTGNWEESRDGHTPARCPTARKSPGQGPTRTAASVHPDGKALCNRLMGQDGAIGWQAAALEISGVHLPLASQVQQRVSTGGTSTWQKRVAAAAV